MKFKSINVIAFDDIQGKDICEKSLKKQYVKIVEEFLEVRELIEHTSDTFIKYKKNELASELFDLIQASYTMLVILERQGHISIEKVNEWNVQKLIDYKKMGRV